jgi:GTP cyclohydrolase I
VIQNKTRVETIENAVVDVLRAVGEDATREGLIGTPNRVARMYGELLSGYNVDPNELLNGALFDVEHEQMVIVTNIEFQSLCEHHMLPFTGTANVAYVPDKKVVGLSKIPRVMSYRSIKKT